MKPFYSISVERALQTLCTSEQMQVPDSPDIWTQYTLFANTMALPGICREVLWAACQSDCLKAAHSTIAVDGAMR